MKTEFIQQYAHTWRTLAGIVKDFDRETWLHYGCGTMTPARDTFHLLQGVKYYIEDSSIKTFVSGKSFDNHCGTISEDLLPSQADVLACIDELQNKTEAWLSNMDFAAENTAFTWTGDRKLMHALFCPGLFVLAAISMSVASSSFRRFEHRFSMAPNFE